MTVVVDVEDLPLEQVTKQLNKLINVIKIVELDPSTSVRRELCSSRSAPTSPPARTSWRRCSCSGRRSSTSLPTR
jgi:acetolactate synthase small subunit